VAQAPDSGWAVAAALACREAAGAVGPPCGNRVLVRAAVEGQGRALVVPEEELEPVVEADPAAVEGQGRALVAPAEELEPVVEADQVGRAAVEAQGQVATAAEPALEPRVQAARAPGLCLENG
jgi:hypothetical protein